MKQPGKITTIPITKGNGKNPYVGDYISLLPVNMLTVPPGEVLDSGFMRSMPGLIKDADVDGVSRGALYSVANGFVYRVCGGKLYQSGAAAMDVAGEGRISIAASLTSVAVAANGTLQYFKRDGSTATLTNWPPSQYFAGSDTPIATGSKSTGYDGTLQVTQTMTDSGRLELTLIPATASGATGASLIIKDGDFGKSFDQDVPAGGTPYLTDVVVSGFKISGLTLTVTYTFNANGASGDDATNFQWRQVVEPTDLVNTQYNLGTAADVTYANSRYAYLLQGTNTFGVTDLDDETKPDRYRPFINAEAIPDPAIGISSQGGTIVVFGTASTEFFTLTGATDTSKAIYKSQSGMMVPIGIAGVHCKVLVKDNTGSEQFAVLSHPATGSVSVYLVGSGRYSEIANREVKQMLADVKPDDIANSVIEYLPYDSHRLIIIRSGSLVLCYDLMSKNWCQLCGSNQQTPHRGIDYVFDGTNITAGDTLDAIAKRIQTAAAGLAKGSTSTFKKLMDATPADLRQYVAASSLTRAFTGSSRTPGQSINPIQFANWYQGVMKNAESRKLLEKYLPKGGMNTLSKFFTVNKGIADALKADIHTGRIVSITDAFDSANKLGDAIVGKATKSILGQIPFVGDALGNAVIAGGSTSAKMNAATDLLISPEFRALAKEQAIHNNASHRAVKAAEQAFEQSEKFKKWSKMLTPSEKTKIQTLGVIRGLEAIAKADTKSKDDNK